MGIRIVPVAADAIRCQARYIQDDWTETVQCVEEVHTPGGFHRAHHPREEGITVAFSETVAIYPKPQGQDGVVEALVAKDIQKEVLRGKGIGATFEQTQNLPDTQKEKGTRHGQVGGDHYRKHKIQPWDIWDEYDLDRYRANAVKYLLRAGDKGPAVQDLRKAIHYIEKCIEREEGK